MNVRAWLHPELPQVGMRRHGCFEGWYYKLVDRDARLALALIPGFAAGRAGHGFVQAMAPALGLQAIYRFPLQDVRLDRRQLDVAVGPCRFRRDGLLVDLHGQHEISGELRFEDIVPFPVKGLLRGPMGPFGMAPGMECYHGIVNVRERLRGTLRIDGQPVDFTGGAGYVEKDWGRSFPQAWVWLQGNHFAREDACFLFSAAIIPWLTGSFLGFFALLFQGGRLHLLATYNGGRLEDLRCDQGSVHAKVRGRAGTLEVQARCDARGLLTAPQKGLMNRPIQESIDADVAVRLTAPDGRTLFEGRSAHGGMECCETELLLNRLNLH